MTPFDKLLVFDTETTAADPEQARIVTAYLGLMDRDGSILIEQEWLVRPDSWIIPDEAAAIHGITTEHALAHGRPLPDVLGQICQIIWDECHSGHVALAGQNLQYDLTLLDRELRRASDAAHFLPRSIEQLMEGVYVLDSLVLDKAIDKYRKGSRKLIDMAAHYGVELSEEEAHGAKADAVASGRVILAMGRTPKGSFLARNPLAEIHHCQVAWKAEQAAGLQTYFRTKGGKPDAIVRGEWPYIPHN